VTDPKQGNTMPLFIITATDYVDVPYVMEDSTFVVSIGAANKEDAIDAFSELFPFAYIDNID
jgi:hypothetical protein